MNKKKWLLSLEMGFCNFAAIPSSECPCSEDDKSGCDMAECSPDMSDNELCEADAPLPNLINYDIGNCPGGYDVFICSQGKRIDMLIP